MRGGSAFWTEERVERLKVLVAEGHSAEAIRVLMEAKTRNMILGKVHRMGLSLKNSSPQRKRLKLKPKKARNWERSGEWSWGSRNAFIKPAKPPKRVEVALAALGVPDPLPEAQPNDKATVSFEDYDHKTMCGFIPGDPREGDANTALKYCGLPIVHGAPAPYCADHLRRCYSLPTIPGRAAAIEAPCAEDVDPQSSIAARAERVKEDA